MLTLKKKLMNFQKITIQLKPDNQEYRDILMANLGEKGFESFVENENSLEAYIPSNSYAEDLLSSLQFDPFFTFRYRNEMIPEQNWNEVWEKNYFKPIQIGSECVVHASFHTHFQNYMACHYNQLI